MQLMPGTAKFLGVKDSFDPVQNITGGAKYLRQMFNQFDGNTNLHLAAYNAGPGNVKKHGGIPPFKETHNMLRKCSATLIHKPIFYFNTYLKCDLFVERIRALVEYEYSQSKGENIMIRKPLIPYEEIGAEKLSELIDLFYAKVAVHPDLSRFSRTT